MKLFKVFYTSALFPIPSLMDICNNNPPVTKQECRPYDNKIEDYVGVLGSLVKDILLGVLFYWYTMDISAAKEWSFSWVFPIIVRDMLLSFIVAGGWDHLMYFSSFSKKLEKYKMNPKYPPPAQYYHDMFFTVLATLTASALEIVVMRLWATGYLPYYAGFWQYPIWSVGLIVTMPYWRLGHFFWIHRLIHPWRTKIVPDLGKILYRHVHSHHHKSPNPTAWSGISMHPVESFLYFSAAIFPNLFWSCHPLLFAITKVDLTVGAMIGHDGFGEPGGGSYFHFLHHKFFEINYGDKLMPFDWLLGTYSDGSDKKDSE
jgi:sterol desaturase/sphingolipid hydroxylase (fatty acid hydroxylase superfamily)